MGFKLMIPGGPVTMKATPLLAAPPAITTTLPVVAPAGTGTMIVVELQFVVVAGVPLNVTVPVPFVAPKFAPVMVTGAVIGPEGGLRLVMLGTGVTVIVALPDLVGSATEVAVRITVGGLGALGGAI